MAPIIAATTTIVNLSNSGEVPPRLPPVSPTADNNKPTTDDDADETRALFSDTVVACQSFIEGFAGGGLSRETSLHEFISSSLMMGFVLLGGLQYCQTPVRRRRFLANPFLVCGFLANGARMILRVHDEKLVNSSLSSIECRVTDQAGRTFVNRPVPRLKDKPEHNAYCTRDTTVDPQDVEENRLIVRQDESLPRPQQGCAFIRSLSSVTITLAEKASAVLSIDEELLAKLRRADDAEDGEEDMGDECDDAMGDDKEKLDGGDGGDGCGFPRLSGDQHLQGAPAVTLA
eukprot:Selendium_serpulae@DN799_c0_g1_i1.p1